MDEDTNKVTTNDDAPNQLTPDQPVTDAGANLPEENQSTETTSENTEDQVVENNAQPSEESVEDNSVELESQDEKTAEEQTEGTEESEEVTANEVNTPEEPSTTSTSEDQANAHWYVVHTFSGHENRVATNLRQRIESEHLEHKIFDILVPTQDKIEIRGGKKEQVKEKIFPGYILVKMDFDDISWLAVRTTQGVTGFVGMSNKPTPIPEKEVQSIVKFMTQGAAPTFKDVFLVNDTVRIIDGPFADFIGKVESVDKEKGKVRVLVSIFGRETPVELDFLQVTKL